MKNTILVAASYFARKKLPADHSANLRMTSFVVYKKSHLIVQMRLKSSFSGNHKLPVLFVKYLSHHYNNS